MIRLVFAVVMAVVLVQGSLVTISRHLRRDIIATHNFYRREVKAANMRRLEWDEKLESAAIKRVESCDIKAPPGEHHYGENVYVSQHVGHYRGMVALALQTWANEGFNYTVQAYGADRQYASQYTQLTWAATQRLGCAIKKCNKIDVENKTFQDSSLIVCLYDPKGNNRLEYPYEISGRKCSHCPAGTYCEKGLCVDGFMSDAAPRKLGGKIKFEERPSNVFRPINEQCRKNEAWFCECRTRVSELRSTSGHLTETEKNLLLSVHNDYRKRKNIPFLVWDSGLEVWSKYVIRCEPLYPGPRYCYTNFGKGVGGAPITEVVDDWVKDNQAIKTHEPWCRTPRDSAVCNRNTNLMQAGITRMACEAMSCGKYRQLICIYSSLKN